MCLDVLTPNSDTLSTLRDRLEQLVEGTVPQTTETCLYCQCQKKKKIQTLEPQRSEMV